MKISGVSASLLILIKSFYTKVCGAESLEYIFFLSERLLFVLLDYGTPYRGSSDDNGGAAVFGL